MTMRSWIRKLFTRPVTRPIRKAPRRTRLVLEGLEDRYCPSTFTVNSIADAGTGSGLTGDLRYCIAQANSLGGNNTIQFDPGVFATAQTITLSGTQLELSDTSGTTTITGPTAGVTINAGGLSRVFQVDAGVTAVFSGQTIEGGMVYGVHVGPTGGQGGGVFNDGTLTLSNCTVTGDKAQGFANNPDGRQKGQGGGIYNDGTLTLSNCTVSGDTAQGGTESALGDRAGLGGGIFSNDSSSPLTVTNCTISGNTARSTGKASDYGHTQDEVLGEGFGGGLYVTTYYSGHNAAVLATLTNCTVTANRAGAGGGVFGHNGNDTVKWGYASTALINCTISGNSALGPWGGGLYSEWGKFVQNGVFNGIVQSAYQFTLVNTIVAGNTGGQAPDASGPFISQGHNLLGDSFGALNYVVGDDQSVDWLSSDLTDTNDSPLNPLLGPLANNGGPTQTMALLPGSPAIDKGNSSASGLPSTDQRGYARIVGNAVDIGADEYQYDLAVSGSPPPSVVLPGQTITYNLTVTNNGPDTAGQDGPVTLTDTLPGGETFQSIQTPSG